MKALVIVLALLGLTFVGLVVFGVARDRDPAPSAKSGAFGSPPPMDGGEPDEDALEDWKAPPVGELLAAALSPFAKKLELEDDRIDARSPTMGMQPDRVVAPPSRDKMRVGRAVLESGLGAVVRYSCAHRPNENRRCPQQVCACAPGVHDDDDFEACGDGWVNARREGDDSIRCEARHARPALVIYREGGVIEAEAIGERSVVRIK